MARWFRFGARRSAPARAVAVLTVTVAAVSGLTGCQPPPARTIDIIGDSIATQAYWHRAASYDGAGRPSGWTVVHDEWIGRTFADFPQAYGPAEGGPDGAPAQILVIAVGTNNAGPYSGGWGDDDRDQFETLLWTRRPSACVVVILPFHVAKAPGVPHPWTALAMDSARVDMTAVAKARPHTVVVDWQPYVRDHPGLIKADGIHLDDDSMASGEMANGDAADAWAKMMWAGVDDCAAG